MRKFTQKELWDSLINNPNSDLQAILDKVTKELTKLQAYKQILETEIFSRKIRNQAKEEAE